MLSSDGLASPASPNTGRLLVFAHCRIDFFPPGIKATFEIQQILKTLPAKKLDHARAADAGPFRSAGVKARVSELSVIVCAWWTIWSCAE